MRTITSVVEAVLEKNACLTFGLFHRLLNLSQTARFLQDLVEAQLRKAVEPSAIATALSRVQQRMGGPDPEQPVSFYVDRIHVHRGLCTLTVPKTDQARRDLQRLHERIRAQGGYLTTTEGMTEITTITEVEHLGILEEVLTVPPRQFQRALAGLGVTFKAQYTESPGLLYQLLQQVALLGVNVAEVASTMTEFTIYLDEADVMPVFDALYQRFAGT